MAETDMKPLSELDLYNNLLDANSLLPMTVNPSGSNITRKVYYPALKIQIAGYELVGTLTAGSTSITLSSSGSVYDAQTDYVVGNRVTESGVNYVCIANCDHANWQTNGRYFAQYTPLSADSTIDVYTKVSGNPWVATPVVSATVADSAVTLTFTAQASDVSVKVRVS